MNKKRTKIIILFILILINPDVAAAYPGYVNDVPGILGNCITCHEDPDGSGLNPYGKDFGDYNNSIEEIAELDSDSDGFSNSEELGANTFPGDPASYPGNEGAPGFDIITLVSGLLGAWMVNRRSLGMKRKG